MKRINFFLLILVSLIFTGCSKDDDEFTMGSLFGYVYDKTTGEPISTAKITLSPGGKSTVTGSDGSFEFNSLESGDYTITVTKENYEETTQAVYVKKGDPTRIDILIARIPDYVKADRTELDFGDNPSTNTLSFNIVNPGYVDLAWTIEERCDWIIEVTPSEGVLPYGKTEGIVVVIDREKLNPGRNEAIIVVRSSNGSSKVTIIASTAEDLPIVQLSTIKTYSYYVKLSADVLYIGDPVYTDRGFLVSTHEISSDKDDDIIKISCGLDYAMYYSKTVRDLNIGKEYYVRAYAINEKGTYISANQKTFTLSGEAPIVYTNKPTNVNFITHTAILNGHISYEGIPSYSERGFVYSTQANPEITDNKIIVNGVGETGYFSVKGENLPESDYFVRAYAISDIGAFYGDNVKVEKDWMEIPSLGIAVQRNDLGSFEWETGKKMCENSRVGGYDDWRLPTIDELAALYLINEEIGNFISSSYGQYWSSTPGSTTDSYQYISFDDGSLGMLRNYFSCYVRAVRTLK